MRSCAAPFRRRFTRQPYHAPNGAPEERRAIQLGLRGEALALYATAWTVAIEDITGLVAEQRTNASPPNWPQLVTPHEREYVVPDAAVARRLGLAGADTPLSSGVP